MDNLSNELQTLGMHCTNLERFEKCLIEQKNLPLIVINCANWWYRENNQPINGIF